MLRERVRSRIEGARTSAHPTGWRAAAALGAMVVLVTFAMARVFMDDRSPTDSTTNRQQTQPGSFRAVEVKAGREALRPESVSSPSPGASKELAELEISPGFQVAPPDEPAAPPFPWLSVEEVAIEPLAAISVAIEDVSVPVPLQVQRLDIAALAMQ